MFKKIKNAFITDFIDTNSHSTLEKYVEHLKADSKEYKVKKAIILFIFQGGRIRYFIKYKLFIVKVKIESVLCNFIGHL